MLSHTLKIVHALLLALAACASHAAAPVPPLESFFENPAFSAALLSPNARYLAVRVGGKQAHDGLAVLDLETMTIKVAANFTNIDIDRFVWVNSERLVFDTVDKRLGAGMRSIAPGLYGVNRDGSELRQLVSHNGDSGVFSSGMAFTEKWKRDPLPWNTYLHHQAGAQDSNSVYVIRPRFNGEDAIDYVDLVKLDTVTGRSQTVARPDFTQRWLLDHKGEPRIAVAIERNMEVVYYRDPGAEQWRKLTEFDTYKGGRGGFTPLGFGPDGTLYVSSDIASDKLALHTYDFKTGQISKEALVSLKDFDFEGELIADKDKLLGVRFLADTESAAWFDQGMKDVQKAVDALLPSTVNLISVGRRAEAPWVLVEAYSDIQPRTFLMFNTKVGELTKIGGTYTGIVPSQMGRQEMVRYKARDGLEIPAWLTLPAGGARKNLPLVLLVHGGPFMRGGAWGWNAESQFLASRGYAVLEPEFRGSTGFGAAHFQAGWKQWGLAMQNDLADGARWAVAQGIADPQRMCIAGASYGGYATLMGLANDPDLYKCGVDLAGPSDIELLYTGHWTRQSDLSERWREYGMPELVGDRVKDALQLKATSPLLQAARIRQPLLLVYGGSDRRVPIYHGKKFYDAVKVNNPNVEWLAYPDEGHGLAVPKNRIDFWSRVEQFLGRHIGKP